MRWWSKKKKPEPELVDTNTLTLMLKNRGNWWIATQKEGKLGADNWSDFTKWYFSRPQSENYTFISHTSKVTIRRENIEGFDISLHKKKRNKLEPGHD